LVLVAVAVPLAMGLTAAGYSMLKAYILTRDTILMPDP
jgi:hypothetical protein